MLSGALPAGRQGNISNNSKEDSSSALGGFRMTFRIFCDYLYQTIPSINRSWRSSSWRRTLASHTVSSC